MPMRAIFLDFASLGPADLDPSPLTRLLPSIRLHDETPPGELASRLADAEIVIVNKVVLDREAIAQARALKLICLAATGTDNVDLEAARSRGIAVANIRNYCTPSVTQHVFALVLALNQRLSEYAHSVATGAWQRSGNFCLLEPPFHELSGRTFGVIGLGTLGRSVARVAEAFRMQVIAAGRPGGPQDTAADAGIPRVGLAELLERAHIISLHCPLTQATRGLINAQSLRTMRRDALLINTARGALVDSVALLDALRAGTIAGAGIDVLEREPPGGDHPLLGARLPNLIVTPHMAWAAREARQRALEEIGANIAAFLREERRNRVEG